jgi:hypothetical protein
VIAFFRARLGLLFLAIALASAWTHPVAAQTTDAPSEDAMSNLIQLLVKKKVLTPTDATELQKEASHEASVARSARAGAAVVPAIRPEPPPPAPGVLRVPYVPQIVKDQIRDEVKADVIRQAKAENWAAPETLPAWTKRVTLFGDFNIRDQFNFYGSNNIGSDGLDGFINFQAFNANGPTQVSSACQCGFAPPILNTTQDRLNLLILRARFGLSVDIADEVGLTLRLDTGQDNGPVSTTQLFGGGFTKKDIWLGLAYIDIKPVPWTWIDLGRMPDPFMATDLVYYDRLSFDGVAWQGRSKPKSDDGLGVFETVGAFPVGYVDANFPGNSITKSPDHTEYLMGSQVGTEWTQRDFNWDFAIAMYYYINAQGELSEPCPIYLNPLTACSTDDTRPPYMQKGNTLFLLRNIIPDPSNPSTYSQPQFVGLANNYHELDATTSLVVS